MAARLPFAFSLALIGLLFAWGAASHAIGVDFLQFWTVAQALDRPGLNVYSDEDRTRLGAEFFESARQTGDARRISVAEYRQKLETYSSPFLYTVFRWITTGNYDSDFRNYRIIILSCLVLSILAFARLLHLAWDLTLLAVAFFAGWFAPFASEMRVGNVNTLQLAALVVYSWVALGTRWRYREIFGGAILGLSLAFKPNLIFVPAMLALAWIFSRQFSRLLHHVIGALSGIIAAVGLSALSFHSLHCWIDWIAAIRSMPAEIISIEYGNYSPGRILSETVGVSAIFVGASFVGLAVAAMWLNRDTASATEEPSPQFPKEMIAIALGCLLVVLAPGLAWLHYHVLLIPVFLTLIAALAMNRVHRIFSALIALALLGYAFEAIGYVAPAPSPFIQSVMVLFASSILFGLTLSLRFSPRRLNRSPVARA